MSAASRKPDAGQRPGEGGNGAYASLKRRHVADIQRALILSAMYEVCSERGASKVTVAHVVAHAGVSRRTFYELFEDSESCLLKALDDAIARAGERVSEAYDGAQPWRVRIRASLTALLRFLEEEPSMGRLLIVESLGAGPNALQRRSRALAKIIPALDAGREEAKKDSGPASLTAEGIAGAVLFVIHRRMIDAKAPPLIELVNPLMSTIVLPYLGPAASNAELTCAVVAPVRARKSKSDPLRDLDMRLTYRTMRVLTTIGANPGASNRQVGRVAGVEDAGQISKLLARLRQLGLITNVSVGAKGAPNAWKLTRKGGEVHDAIVVRTLPGVP